MNTLYHFFARPLQDIAGIGPKLAKAMQGRGVNNMGELLMHTPNSWRDDQQMTPLDELETGQSYRVQGTIVESHAMLGQERLLLRIADDHGDLRIVFFHARYLCQDPALYQGNIITLRGQVSLWQGQQQMTHPDWQPLATFTAGITPHYPMLAGKGDRALARYIDHALALLPTDASSPLDPHLAEPTFGKAVRYVHQPPPYASDATLQQALQRIKKEELYVYHLLMQERHHAANCPAAVMHQGVLCEALLQQFEAPLTMAQQQVWQEITHDLQTGMRMHRLVQGDVGCGKTWVASLAMALCLDHDYQVALMAPTAVLASQHTETLQALFAPMSLEVALLTSSTRASTRKKICNHLAAGDLKIVIGTHALLSDDVLFKNLALAVVDEQHRFGVRQRWALTEKGEGVHLLAMTATPIPRSLAMALYGDLHISIMRGMPAGRLPVETRMIANNQRKALAAGMQRMLTQGGHIYWITPRIDNDHVSVMQRAEAMRHHFPDAGVEALHGQMKAAEKVRILIDFGSGSCRLLVATTVVEVGVHVPKARLIVIEEADHYGLAQLHQLRGRVGRACEQGYCILLPSAQASPQSLRRLEKMVVCHDGLALAELDLAHRGAGDAVGVQQSGNAAFRMIDPTRDSAMIQSMQDASLPDILIDDTMRVFWRPISEGID